MSSRRLLLCALLALGVAIPAGAQDALSTTAVYPTRFVAARGTQALLSGNTAAGLEGWVYPLQLFRGLEPSFRVAGASHSIAGKDLLRRIVCTPTATERLYIGPGFTVREQLFVPPDLPGAVLTYTVEATQAVAVELTFTPVFDLMWPVGMGGQEVHWHDADKTFHFEEPTHRFFAMLGSPDTEAHDELTNTHAPLTSEARLHLSLAPSHQVRLLMASDAGGETATRAVYAALLAHSSDLLQQAIQAVATRTASLIGITTPDPEVNQALAWSQTALEQAWVCNPKLGCSLVAGYGPSRGISRRPQYAWFFADDALVSLPALLLSGDFDRARDTLLFLLRFQDQHTGMMWHELSQSAAFVDWAKDYPYMFAHVDVSYRFLVGVAHYTRVTGDLSLVRKNWSSLASAYTFCSSLIDASAGLPRVPAGKEGHNEQDHPREELELAVDWAEAADAFAFLSAVAGHPESQASAAARRARLSIPAHFWNAQTDFWNSGIDAAGNGLGQLRLPSPFSLTLLDDRRRSVVLDRIAGSGFQVPWGARDLDRSSRGYDANSYATGSVWAASTAEAAEDLWQGGRPQQAWQVWRKLLPWLALDSLGHLHETLSGAAFEPQTESVPEQTWSSALLLSSFLDGVAGLHLDAAAHQLTLAPHLPADWPSLALKRVRVGQASVDLSLDQTKNELRLSASAHGDSVSLTFRPTLPAGSRVSRLLLDGRPCHPAQSSILEYTLPLAAEGPAHILTVQYTSESGKPAPAAKH